MASDILIVDDEADIRENIAGLLGTRGTARALARDSDEALKAVEERRPQLVILDIWLQGSRLDGLEVLNIIKRAHPGPAGGDHFRARQHRDRGNGHQARRLRLYRKAVQGGPSAAGDDAGTGGLQAASRGARAQERSAVSFEMIGKSTAINQLRAAIERVAPTNSRVLIRGAAGSGKELCARVMHMSSHRKDGPFVVLNAAAMAPDRVEEELFGTEDHVGPRKVGALEEAHSGTLYIDEIADMPIETQSKVLRVLVEQKFQRVGGGPKVSVDVRIISSTSRDLERDMAEGRFREDLYTASMWCRCACRALPNGATTSPADPAFRAAGRQSSGLAPRRIGEDATAVLQAHDWPGNVRELRNNIERLLILSGGDPDAVITANMLPEEIGSNVPLPVNGGAEHLMSLPLREAREIFEREYLLAQINRFGGNISRTAEFVGMERSALHRKLRALGVSSQERGSDARQALSRGARLTARGGVPNDAGNLCQWSLSAL